MIADLFSPSAPALFQVVMIDIVLAGDNAIVIGLAAAGLPKEQRTKVIIIGIAAAAVVRICLSLVTTQLLSVLGLMLAGGMLLLLVSGKMWCELRYAAHLRRNALVRRDDTNPPAPLAPHKTLRQAIWQIIVADFSMSLDNVLAVGGAAREHPWVLVFGLTFSIALTAFVANWIARLLRRHHWLGYMGLVVIVYVALEMIWRGRDQIASIANVLKSFF
jgi:YjbE family integral membrane protein